MVPRIECSRLIRAQFVLSALGAYPKEAYAVLLGHREPDRIRIVDLWFPEDQAKYATTAGIAGVATRKPWMRKAVDIAESEGLEIVGDLHSHPGTTDASPSTYDWQTNKADWVMGICRVKKSGGTFKTSLAWWYGRPKMLTRWV